jgi:Glycosyl transferases group 1
MKIERVAIFGLDFPNIVNQIVGLRDGFRQLGVEVLTAWPHPNALTLENVLDSFRPDFVFEINRSRNQIAECGETFRHVCWMEDIQSLGSRLDAGFGGSDLAYFIFPPSTMGYGAGLDQSVRYLMPAINPDIFAYRVEPPIFDFSFVGQIFAPVSDELRAQPINIGDAPCGTVGELMDLFERQRITQSSHTLKDTAAALIDYVRRRCPAAEAAMIDPAIKNIFDEYYPRMMERTRMLDKILSISSKVGFFGTGPWHKWPQYQNHFGGYLNRQGKMALVFRRTKVNLHNGICGMHFRVLDCMASGGAIMVNKSKWDGTPFGIDRYFEAGRHYIEYDFDNLGEAAAEALADEPRRRRIGAAAAEAVRAGHTWRDRAAQIIEDVRAL